MEEEQKDKKKLQAEDEESSEEKGLDIEPVLQELGPRGLGLYQCVQISLLLCCIFSVAFSIMSVVFIGYKPSYQCASVNTSKLETLIGWSLNSSDHMTVKYGECSITVERNDSGQVTTSSLPCVEGYDYEGSKDASFFTEWDLTCGKSALTEVTQTLMMVGQAVGAVFFTSFADRFGRKPVYVTSSLAMLVVSVATAFSPNYVFFIFCRVLTGAIQQGTGLVAFTAFLELLPRQLRGAAGVIDGSIWSFAIMVLPGLAYLLRHHSWRYLQLAFAASSVYALCLPWCVDESLRWLVANKKRTMAERVVKRASRINRVPYHKVRQALHTLLDGQPIEDTHTSPSANENEAPDDEMKPTEIQEKLLLDKNVSVVTDSANGSNGLKAPINGVFSTISEVAQSDGVEKYTALDILRTRCLLKTTVIITYLWITNSLTYYGLMLTSASLAGNRFLNFFLQGLMEFPAYLTVYFCLKRFGRRNVACGFLCVAACSLLLSSLLTVTVKSPVVGPITNALSLLGKYGISGSFCVLFIFCPELFPTNLRTAGLGIASSLARLGGMVAPFTNNLAAVALWAPGILFGGMALLAAYVILLLPETKGRPMPTTIEDMKRRYGTPSNNNNNNNSNRQR